MDFKEAADLNDFLLSVCRDAGRPLALGLLAIHPDVAQAYPPSEVARHVLLLLERGQLELVAARFGV